MPELETYGPIELVHDPNLPDGLINDLDQFTDTLQDSQLDDDHLATAKQRVTTATKEAGRGKIETEVSVLRYFDRTVAAPVEYFCLALGLEMDYGVGPKIYNIDPDFAWIMEEEAIAIFEHTVPWVAERHFPEIIDRAKKREKLDLSNHSSNAASILSKLIMTSIYKKLDYCAVHSAVSFIFIHIVRDNETQCYQARISGEIPLTSSTTPITAVVLALILHSRKYNQALNYRSLEVQFGTIGNVSSEQDAAGSHKGASAPGPYTSPDRQVGSNPSNSRTNSKIQMPDLPAVSEYWEAKELSEVELAALLNTTNVISLYWDMEPFTKRVFRPLRRDDSSLWNKPLSVEAIPRLVTHSSGDHHSTPPPSPPMVPLLLRLSSAVGRGAAGSVYRGCFHDLDMPIIVKILPTDRMDHELEIWRRLRGFAGVDVPGLFGAYSIEGEEGQEDTGALVQQYAGTSLQSFDLLNLEQRRELYRIVAKIHEANVEHGDVAPRNVTLDSNGRVMVIDFSHSNFHECEHDNCDELQHLRQKLELLE